MWKRNCSSLGAVHPNAPSRSAMKPSTETSSWAVQADHTAIAGRTEIPEAEALTGTFLQTGAFPGGAGAACPQRPPDEMPVRGRQAGITARPPSARASASAANPCAPALDESRSAARACCSSMRERHGRFTRCVARHRGRRCYRGVHREGRVELSWRTVLCQVNSSEVHRGSTGWSSPVVVSHLQSRRTGVASDLS
jgi:hypothetical protein